MNAIPPFPIACRRADSLYAHSTTAALETIYAAVEKDFTTCYRTINGDDETDFDSKLRPSLGKLALDVDFYGRGLFPPGAYHSEGHQDGMGLCLYLALMKHTLADKFTFCVLDDVLMSVDVGHRREVCRLLKKEFPQTQFILTTHDPIWLQFMKTENLIPPSISFGAWNVETGPNVWQDRDAWDRIAADLDKNDVSSAATSLRRYLEYMASILADNLRAPIEFHGDGQYDLGDLLPSVLGEFRRHLAKAREAATSWDRTEEAKKIAFLESAVKTKVAQSQVEQWMINKAVHYNAWANLQKSEFKVVVNAFKELLGTMRCSNAACDSYLYVTAKKGPKESLRCNCGAANFSLKVK